MSGLTRAQAQTVSQHDGRAAYGGTPADRTVVDAIRALKARGLKVTLYPFVMMDVPENNGFPDPYGDVAQAAYPWRGRITCDPAPGRPGSADRTGTARTQVEAFLGSAGATQFVHGGDTVAFTGNANDWGFRRHILHYAHLAAMAGGVDGFIIGSEMPGLTRVRDTGNAFPFVEGLVALAEDVRSILGGGTRITYAADWSEYFGYHPQDGSGDVFFHLDELWASEAIDCIGIDNYMPLSDWRDEDVSGGNPDGAASAYDLVALKAAITGGEGFDWYYASPADRHARVRTPIGDGAYGKDWVFRYKDLPGWWSNLHYNRIGGVEQAQPTAWVPMSKPFHFTELGCGAVDKGPNQPNLFRDPKSAENGIPHFSNGGRSDLAQYRFLLAHHLHWQEGGEEANPTSPVYGGRMVDPDALSVWAWDLRPFPAFPVQKEVWGDGENWICGHWLNGRLNAIPVGALIDRIMADFGLPAAATSRADGMVSGYVIANPTTARAALEPIVELFGISVRSQGDRLVFATEGMEQTDTIPAGDLVIPDEGDVLARVRTPDHDLPGQVHLDFRDQLNEHQSATACVDLAGTEGAGTRFISFPGVLAADEAETLAANFLHRIWDRREGISFALPITRQDVRVGRIIRLDGEDRDYLVTEIEEGLVRRVQAVRIRRSPDMPATEGRIPAGGGGEPLTFGKPYALLMDLPLVNGEDQPHERLRIAVRAKPWKSQAVYCSPETTGFSFRGVVAERAIIGELVAPLPGTAVTGRLDPVSRVDVRLFDGELESVSLPLLLGGANAAAVLADNGVWEILQFHKAQEIAVNRWVLDGLLRGQHGTTDAMRAGAGAGSPFVLLNGAVTAAGLRPEETGLLLNWRIGPAGFDLSDTHFSSLGASGGTRALLPLAPVHLRCRINGGDVHFSWTRSDRSAESDSWLSEDIPLSETDERYLVEVVADDGETVVRSQMVSVPVWVYPSAEILGDFGVMPDAVTLRVRQISVRVGPGVAAERRFNLA